MRLARLLLASAALIAPLTPALAPVPVLAQARPALPACTGSINIVRVSEIKPGMMDKFKQAVAAQQAWYKAAGTTDVIVLMQVVDVAKGTLSDTQALTSHISDPAAKAAPHDAGYDAFVALFKDSSTITTQFITCMPKMMRM